MSLKTIAVSSNNLNNFYRYLANRISLNNDDSSKSARHYCSNKSKPTVQYVNVSVEEFLLLLQCLSCDDDIAWE